MLGKSRPWVNMGQYEPKHLGQYFSYFSIRSQFWFLCINFLQMETTAEKFRRTLNSPQEELWWIIKPEHVVVIFHVVLVQESVQLFELKKPREKSIICLRKQSCLLREQSYPEGHLWRELLKSHCRGSYQHTKIALDIDWGRPDINFYL